MNQHTDINFRFWSRVDKTPTCWNWTGSTAGKDSTGYGKLRFGGVCTQAHRVSWQLLRGEIPTEATLDHLCKNKLCVNPEHLEPVSRGENSRRYALSFTHCANGHEFNAENTRIDGKTGWRRCRVCARNWARDNKN